ncbi:MAG: hypothetical protein H0W68_00810 [Gemmatimonadaceae bacterium]|nr:hypothetical protein [Gemmatimonadaceae bacterium]
MADLLDDSPLAEWLRLSEALQAGLVHALNNRITALSAFAELAELGDDALTAQSVLPRELSLLHQLNGLFRLLVSDTSTAEALEVGPVLDDALALHAHHPSFRSLRCTVMRQSDLPPVRTPRGALLRVLLLIIEHVKEEAEATGDGTMTLTVEADERELSVSAARSRGLGRYALALAERCGGTLEIGASTTRFSLPTLAELRRREKARTNSD